MRLGHWRLGDVRHVTTQVHRKPEPRMHLRLEEPPSRHITSLSTFCPFKRRLSHAVPPGKVYLYWGFCVLLASGMLEAARRGTGQNVTCLICVVPMKSVLLSRIVQIEEGLVLHIPR